MIFFLAKQEKRCNVYFVIKKSDIVYIPTYILTIVISCTFTIGHLLVQQPPPAVVRRNQEQQQQGVDAQQQQNQPQECGKMSWSLAPLY